MPASRRDYEGGSAEAAGDYAGAKQLNGWGSNGRSKNDKNWENWERIREQKLEKMKNICFESYRQSKRDKMLLAKPKPRQLDPTWYTDNIYSNRSEDNEEDYVPDCLKYGTYKKLRNIREQDEFFNGDDDELDGGGGGIPRGRRGEGEGSPGYALQRSTSCKEFHYPKSQSCCFDGFVYEGEGEGAATAGGSSSGLGSVVRGGGMGGGRVVTTSILKNRGNVPKSYSFSATSKTTPFDVMDYDLPPAINTRREKQEAFRKSQMASSGNGAGNYGYCCGAGGLEEGAHAQAQALAHMRECCAREHCTNANCLLDEIYPGYAAASTRRSWRRAVGGGGGGGGGVPASGLYGAGASGGSNRNLHAADWIELEHRGSGHRGAALGTARYSHVTPPTVICCCAVDDYCCHRQPQHHIARPRSRLHCPGHHPAAEEEEHLHCRPAVSYDADLEHFIRDERERLLLQDKFLDEDERYLAGAGAGPSLHYASSYRRPARSKSLLEVQPPSRYDEDTCSDSTEMDLEDFNIDLEKYWEELEKPPSPIDIDMQRRNMHSNLKVKNVNVGCYNNGQPIAMHDREHERMLIKKSLLEGMPSPPQAGPSNNATDYHFFEHASGSPLHRGGAYGHKVYPSVDALPSYKYNNFYPEHAQVQTQQPTAGAPHASAGGHSALSLINNIFSIYKPNKYSPHNCQMNVEAKPEPCKKMNVPSTRRPLGAPHSEYMHSMKRPLIVSNEQPHFKIIPEKTGLKISPLYTFDDYGEKPLARHKLTSTARPLMLPH